MEKEPVCLFICKLRGIKTLDQGSGLSYSSSFKSQLGSVLERIFFLDSPAVWKEKRLHKKDIFLVSLVTFELSPLSHNFPSKG